MATDCIGEKCIETMAPCMPGSTQLLRAQYYYPTCENLEGFEIFKLFTDSGEQVYGTVGGEPQTQSGYFGFGKTQRGPNRLIVFKHFLIELFEPAACNIFKASIEETGYTNVYPKEELQYYALFAGKNEDEVVPTSNLDRTGVQPVRSDEWQWDVLNTLGLVDIQIDCGEGRVMQDLRKERTSKDQYTWKCAEVVGLGACVDVESLELTEVAELRQLNVDCGEAYAMQALRCETDPSRNAVQFRAK